MSFGAPRAMATSAAAPSGERCSVSPPGPTPTGAMTGR